MKTMLELLIRLQELRHSADWATRNPQLSGGEKATARCLKSLVRDCLPPTVLVHYDILKRQKPEMLRCPEVFAMAVLVSAYRNLFPRGRRKLLAYFDPSPASSVRHSGHGRLRNFWRIRVTV